MPRLAQGDICLFQAGGILLDLLDFRFLNPCGHNFLVFLNRLVEIEKEDRDQQKHDSHQAQFHQGVDAEDLDHGPNHVGDQQEGPNDPNQQV